MRWLRLLCLLVLWCALLQILFVGLLICASFIFPYILIPLISCLLMFSARSASLAYFPYGGRLLNLLTFVACCPRLPLLADLVRSSAFPPRFRFVAHSAGCPSCYILSEDFATTYSFATEPELIQV